MNIHVNFAKRFLLGVMLWLCTATVVLAQTKELYHLVRIQLSPAKTLLQLDQLGLPVDHGTFSKTSAEVVLSESEIAKLVANGYAYSIVQQDMEKFYAERLAATLSAARQELAAKQARRFAAGSPNATDAVPVHFRLGSMGGFLTFTEMATQLDSMKLLYPNLITTKQSLGNTLQNRPIWMVKFGSAASTGKPQVLLTGMHHAREPGAMMTLMYYMWYLLENYGTDPEATFLLDNREIYFLPCTNPDGYEYNRSTNPSGGGMWRKNRQTNSDASFGVDLNRNYGPFTYWNANNGGSSTIPSDDTYRGTAPFSELETQLIKTFAATKHFKSALNYHTYGNLLIYPYGYASAETPDSLIYRRFAADMTTVNHYATGLDLQTVGYSTRGNSDDFLYSGDTTAQGKVFAMTPEVGTSSDGFWPASTRILPQAQENLTMNLYLARIAGPLVTGNYVTMPAFIGINTTASVTFSYFNKGLGDAAAGGSVQLVALDTLVQIVQGSATLGSIASQTSVTTASPFQIRVKPSALPGQSLRLVSRIAQEGGVITTDTLTFIAGTPTTVFTDGAESGITGWTTAGNMTWGIVSTYAHSGTKSFTDSPNGNYINNANATLSLATGINLTNISKAYLDYYARWSSIEATWDFAQVLASSNGGTTWIPLHAAGMHIGSGLSGSVQPATEYGYDGTQTNWIHETIDVSSFIGSTNFKVQFRLKSDGSTNGDGIYIDDVSILTIPTAVGTPKESAALPQQFRLDQNYPNPFNPSTVISYQLPASSLVSLKVYDVLGREVAVLVNERKDAGRHDVSFNAGQLSSGVYFYKLTANATSGAFAGFSETRKMLLVK